MHYSIIILDNNFHMYLDIVYMLAHSFEVNNIPYTLINYTPNLTNDENNKCIFFGTAYYGFAIPDGSILTEFDCVEVTQNRSNLQTLIQKNSLFSYSRNVINYIKQLSHESKVGMFYYGYSKYLDFGYNRGEQDIDICFVGNVNDQRKVSIIDEIKDRFKDRKLFFGGYSPYLEGQQRGDIYKRSKIVLSIYSKESLFNYSSGSRIFPAVSTGAFVIAEKCNDSEQFEILDKICINTEPEKLLDTIEYYLFNSQIREIFRAKFYENIKNIQAHLEQ